MDDFSIFQNRCTNKRCNHRTKVEIEFPQDALAIYEYDCPSCGEIIEVNGVLGLRDHPGENPGSGECRALKKQ